MNVAQVRMRENDANTSVVIVYAQQCMSDGVVYVASVMGAANEYWKRAMYE
jgi:hypothetical protein